MIANHTNSYSKSFTPLVNSGIDNNVVVNTAQQRNHPLFQFINTVDVCLSVTLLRGRLDNCI